MRVLTLCGLCLGLLVMAGVGFGKDDKKEDKKELPTVHVLEGDTMPIPANLTVAVGDTIRFHLSVPYNRTTSHPNGEIKVVVDNDNAKVEESRYVRLVNGKPSLTGTDDRVYDVETSKKGKVTITATVTNDGKDTQSKCVVEITDQK